jgi:hypothetical protein
MRRHHVTTPADSDGWIREGRDHGVMCRDHGVMCRDHGVMCRDHVGNCPAALAPRRRGFGGHGRSVTRLSTDPYYKRSGAATRPPFGSAIMLPQYDAAAAPRLRRPRPAHGAAGAQRRPRARRRRRRRQGVGGGGGGGEGGAERGEGGGEFQAAVAVDEVAVVRAGGLRAAAAAAGQVQRQC